MTNRCQTYKQALGTTFQLITAFSREGPHKVYVQDRLREHAHEVSRLLNHGAHVYICGDAANMARQVRATLIQILVDQRNITAAEADQLLKTMKNQKLYQVRNCLQCRNTHEALPHSGQLLNIKKLTRVSRKMFGEGTTTRPSQRARSGDVGSIIPHC